MIVWLDSTESDRASVGGKGAELINLVAAGFSVPEAFIITTDEFNSMDEKLEDAVLSAFDKLGSTEVAVRSSAIAEDGAKASWAGQFDTFLKVARDDLVQKVQDCWASAHTRRAEAYAESHHVGEAKLKVAVIVQRMINPKVAGVAFSINPVNNDQSQMVIEATVGLGDDLVSGRITPDNYVVSKDNHTVIESHLADDVLSSQQIEKLSSTIQSIEDHYQFPVDIEWTIDSEKLWIMQARPITTIDIKTERAIELSKLFSREKGLWYAYLWNECDRASFKKYLGYNIENNLYIYDKEKVSVWYDLHERKTITTLLSQALDRKDFIPKLLEEIDKQWMHLGPFLIAQQSVSTFDELKQYYQALRDWWVPMTIIFNLSNVADKAIPDDALAAREKAEKYSDQMGNIWNDFWKSQDSKFLSFYPLLTPDESFKAQELQEKEIKEITKRYYTGLLNGNLYTRDELQKYLESINVILADKVTDSKTVTGQPAYKGIVQGRVRIILFKKDIPKLCEGEILVTDMTSPKFLPAIQKCIAMVTDEGGVTSHAAIVARELKKPCVIGTKVATQTFRNDDLVKVNADTGDVRIIERSEGVDDE